MSSIIRKFDDISSDTRTYVLEDLLDDEDTFKQFKQIYPQDTIEYQYNGEKMTIYVNNIVAGCAMGRRIERRDYRKLVAAFPNSIYDPTGSGLNGKAFTGVRIKYRPNKSVIVFPDKLQCQGANSVITTKVILRKTLRRIQQVLSHTETESEKFYFLNFRVNTMNTVMSLLNSDAIVDMETLLKRLMAVKDSFSDITYNAEEISFIRVKMLDTTGRVQRRTKLNKHGICVLISHTGKLSVVGGSSLKEVRGAIDSVYKYVAECQRTIVPSIPKKPKKPKFQPDPQLEQLQLEEEDEEDDDDDANFVKRHLL